MSKSLYCLKLPAASIIEVSGHRAVLEKALPYCDVLFGHAVDAWAFQSGLDGVVRKFDASTSPRPKMILVLLVIRIQGVPSCWLCSR